MASAKNTHYSLAAAVVVLLLSLLPTGIAAQIEWQTLTSFKEVRRLTVIDDTLYTATSGGLLRITAPGLAGRESIHTDGLGTTDLRDAIIDADGRRWLAGRGRLIRFDDLASRQYLFSDNEGTSLSLYSLVDDGENLWVGAGIGLVLFSKVIDGGQIQDSYTLFGDLNPSPIVNQVRLHADTLWLATSSGLAVAPSTDPVLLKSPLAWTVFDVGRYPELGSDTIRSVAVFEGDVYVATARGAFRLDRRLIDTVFTPLTIADGEVVSDLVAVGDSMFVYHSGGLSVVVGGAEVDLPTTGLPTMPVTGGRFGADRWVAVADSGLYYWSGDQYELYPFTGTPGNDVRSLVMDRDGILTVGFGDKVYAQYDGFGWAVRPLNARDGTMDLLTDDYGNVWAASWGEGLWRLTPDSTLNYDERNSTCIGISGAPSYVVVRGLATDGVHIFATLYFSVDGDVVAWAPITQADDPAAWSTFGVADGLTTTLVSSLAYGAGELTVGTTGNGIFRCDLGDDPYRGDPPIVTHFTDDNSRLRSNSIRTVAYSPRGNVWVGTNLGISRWDPGIERFVDDTLPEGIGPDVSGITFDGLGNAWVGTRTGLGRIDAETGERETFTTANSGLVSDMVRDVSLHRPTGNIYVATDGGISVVKTQIENYTTAADSILAIPNPFVIRSDADRLSFNYDSPALVTIYTVSGEPVADFSVAAGWDGRNESGKQVASGVYIYLITNGPELVARGKILLIRE